MTVSDKIKSGFYTNKLSYPDCNTVKCCNIVHPKKAKFCSECGMSLLSLQKVYDESKKAYRDRDTEIYDTFKKDALTEVGLINHPKADKVFAKAWDYGNGSNLAEVLYSLGILTELFID